MTDKPKARRGDALPHSLAPIGLSREVAAAFIDVSPSKFDQLVADGRMPKPKRIDRRRVWDRRKIERAFSDLPGDEDFEEDEWAAFDTFQVGERRQPELLGWEWKLLSALYRSGGKAHASTLEGGGPVSRRTLAGHGLIIDNGGELSITDEGKRRAQERLRYNL